jgi:D-alanyl-D-alanine dipeptidase
MYFFSLIYMLITQLTPTEPALPPSAFNNYTQIIVVEAHSTGSSEATLRLYQKNEGSWKQALNDMPARIGKNGTAWGLGLHQSPNQELQKKEGDRKSPAGIFQLGDSYAYKSAKRQRTTNEISPQLKCVDDSKSKYYNQIVNTSKNTPDWDSAEDMQRTDDCYKYVVEIKHNPTNKAYCGSCIFLHVQATPTSGTAGCTALSPSNMERLLGWLSPKPHKTLFVLGTKTQLSYLRNQINFLP